MLTTTTTTIQICNQLYSNYNKRAWRLPVKCWEWVQCIQYIAVNYSAVRYGVAGIIKKVGKRRIFTFLGRLYESPLTPPPPPPIFLKWGAPSNEWRRGRWAMSTHLALGNREFLPKVFNKFYPSDSYNDFTVCAATVHSSVKYKRILIANLSRQAPRSWN